VTVVAGFGLDDTGIAFDPFKRNGARLAAGDAHRANMIPRGGAQRAIEVTRPRRLAGRCHQPGTRQRSASRAQSALRQQSKIRRRQARGHAGKVNLKRRRDPQHRTGVGSRDVAVKKFIRQGFDRDGVPPAQLGDDRLHLRRHRCVVKTRKQHRKPIPPGRVPAMSIGGERRHAGIDRLLDDSFVKTGES
jgi:hypothetical protein